MKSVFRPANLDLDGCFKLLVGVTNRSMEDALISNRIYHRKRPNKKRALELAKDLMEFTKSEWYYDICEHLGHRPDVVSTHILLRLKDGKKPCQEQIQKTLWSASHTGSPKS